MALLRFIAALFGRFSRRWRRLPEPGENLDHWLGRQGEHLAARHLRRHGYKVLYRNFRARHGGEVDIVCRDKSCDTLVFVEVKTRRSERFGSPAEAVTREKQKLIARGAAAWLRLLDHPEIPVRFDIVEIVIESDGPKINVVRDAFQLPEHIRL